MVVNTKTLVMARMHSANADLSSDGRIFIRPGSQSKLRQLERALHAESVPIHLDASAVGVSIKLSDFDRCRTALANWDLSVSSSADAAIASMKYRRKWHSDALSVCQTVRSSPETAASWLTSYGKAAMLDAHQVTAVALASHPDVKGLCIFDEQGLGKTIEALFAFDNLREKGLVGRAVIFAPKNMILEWVHDLGRFFNDKYKAVAIVGDERAKREALDSDADLYVTNFETALQLEVRLRQLLQRETGKALLIVDESFFVKNTEAQRTRALRRLRGYADRCIVLCGTPAPNSAVDLIEQFNIADGGIAFEGVEIPTDREQARAVISSIIESRGVYIRRLKEAVFPNLPDRAYSRVLIELSPQQRRLYNNALSGLIADVHSADDASFKRELASFMARRIALLQICSNPSSVDITYSGELPAKLAALDLILADLIATRREKVVLWSFFSASLTALFERYAHYNPVRVDGSVSDVAVRREAVRRFQADDNTMLFIGNPAAAGAGLTLHRARYAIYESMSNQAAHYLQSLDRIHRRGQERPVEYIVLLCDETIEPQEYDRLLMKEADARDLLGDEVKSLVTRESFLEDLIRSRSHDSKTSRS